jgi:hypothetical protein
MGLLLTDLIDINKPVEGYFDGVFIQVHPSSNNQVYIHIPKANIRKYMEETEVLEFLNNLEIESTKYT